MNLQYFINTTLDWISSFWNVTPSYKLYYYDIYTDENLIKFPTRFSDKISDYAEFFTELSTIFLNVKRMNLDALLISEKLYLSPSNYLSLTDDFRPSVNFWNLYIMLKHSGYVYDTMVWGLDLVSPQLGINFSVAYGSYRVNHISDHFSFLNGALLYDFIAFEWEPQIQENIRHIQELQSLISTEDGRRDYLKKIEYDPQLLIRDLRKCGLYISQVYKL